MCKRELNEPGAVLISPPQGNDVVIKFHLCKSCYKPLEKKLV
jgi:hypothetical protein